MWAIILPKLFEGVDFPATRRPASSTPVTYTSSNLGYTTTLLYCVRYFFSILPFDSLHATSLQQGYYNTYQPSNAVGILSIYKIEYLF